MAVTPKLAVIKKELLNHIRNRAFIHLEKPVTLASGKVSRTYFDGKQITLFPESAVLFARAILELVNLDNVDAVGGPTLGADPIASVVSAVAFLEKKKQIPAFLIRREPKKHGLQKQIEGCFLSPGKRVMMVEDVVTSGRTLLEAIRVVEAAGCQVIQIIALVDREEGGTKALSKYCFTPLFRRSEISS